MTRRPLLGCLFEIVETLALTFLIFLGIQTFVAQPYRVQQQSMERTLEPDQYVLVDKLTPRFGPYERGDIIVFSPPGSFPQPDGAPLIKRVIGVAGDRVEIRNGSVWVNGEALAEPYVYEGQPTNATGGRSEWMVPADAYFVMGDHRSSSADSRVFGTIDAGAIIGRAWLRYWPVDVFGILQPPRYESAAGAVRRHPA